VSIPSPRFHRASITAFAICIALASLLSGCASRDGAAPSSELVSSGWENAPALAPVADFDACVAQVLRVVGLSHLALHISPGNPHYGVSGNYRNCGITPFRSEDEVRSCRQAKRLWYGAGGQSPPAGEAGARATFNPHYPDLERRIGAFLDQVDGST
jgi:hypothetical protein